MCGGISRWLAGLSAFSSGETIKFKLVKSRQRRATGLDPFTRDGHVLKEGSGTTWKLSYTGSLPPTACGDKWPSVTDSCGADGGPRLVSTVNVEVKGRERPRLEVRDTKGPGDGDPENMTGASAANPGSTQNSEAVHPGEAPLS